MEMHNSHHDVGANVGSWGLVLLSVMLNWIYVEDLNGVAELLKNIVQIGAALSALILSVYTLRVRIKESRKQDGQ